MAEKGVIVEFDFTVLNGAQILYDTTRKLLKELDNIELDLPKEAKYLAGGNYQGGLAELFAAVKTKKTSQKAARELAIAFEAALVQAIPQSITPAFRNFLKILTDKGVKVILATRANLEKVQSAFESILGDNVVLYHEGSSCYGSVKWDSWRRVCSDMRLRHVSTIAVTGSGFGVKSALLAGMGAMAVINDHVAYQDFSGADAIVKDLSSASAKTLLSIMRIG